MTQKEAVARWTKSAQDNLVVARDLMKLGHYDWALFMGQLAIEKLLKGRVVDRTDETPPYIHDLVKLAILAKLMPTKEQKKLLAKITQFHIQARYEDIKKKFYHEATKAFAREWIRTIEEFVVWIQKHY